MVECKMCEMTINNKYCKAVIRAGTVKELKRIEKAIIKSCCEIWEKEEPDTFEFITSLQGFFTYFKIFVNYYYVNRIKMKGDKSG